MNVTSATAPSRYNHPTAAGGGISPSRSFAEMLISTMSATSATGVGANVKPSPEPGSLDEWLQSKISSGTVPKTVGDAGKKADELSSYLSGYYSNAFKDAGIEGSHGLSPSFQNGEFGVVGRMIQLYPDQPITGKIGAGNYGVTKVGEGVGVDSEPTSEPLDFNYYYQMMSKMIDDCLKDVFDKGQSDMLGEFSLNKSICELSKFKPEFSDAYNRNPSAALDDYRDDILYYMENAMFPAKGS